MSKIFFSLHISYKSIEDLQIKKLNEEIKVIECWAWAFALRVPVNTRHIKRHMWSACSDNRTRVVRCKNHEQCRLTMLPKKKNNFDWVHYTAWKKLDFLKNCLKLNVKNAVFLPKNGTKVVSEKKSCIYFYCN